MELKGLYWEHYEISSEKVGFICLFVLIHDNRGGLISGKVQKKIYHKKIAPSTCFKRY